MNLLDLKEKRPVVSTFHRALGGILKTGVHLRPTTGRTTDAFVYVLHGEAHYDFHGYTAEAHDGDLLYLSKGSWYTITVPAGAYCYLMVEFSFFQNGNDRFRSVIMRAPGEKETENLFHRILTIWQRQTQTKQEDCMSVLYAIYSDFLRAGSVGYISAENRDALQIAIDYIDTNITDPDLSVEQIAKELKISQAHFRRIFKKKYKQTPLQYITMIRITKAKNELRRTSKSIASIAESIGFSDPNYFCVSFKKETGCTPSEYRRITKKQTR